MTIPDTVPGELSIAEFRNTAAAIEAEIGKVIVGQRDVVRHVLIAILAGGHALLEGVPWAGQDDAHPHHCRHAPSGVQPHPVHPGPDAGRYHRHRHHGRVATGCARSFRFQRGPIFANLVLADEINRATPKTQSALLEAMQEKTVTVANETYSLPRPFFVLATQNPLEMEGTYPLPEAQLDRFLFKVHVPFPSAADLTEILDRTTGKENPQASNVADGAMIMAMQALIRQVPIPSHVSEYISRLIVATHPRRLARADCRPIRTLWLQPARGARSGAGRQSQCPAGRPLQRRL